MNGDRYLNKWKAPAHGPMTGFYHIGFAVQDIDQAIHDFGCGLGVQWSPVQNG